MKLFRLTEEFDEDQDARALGFLCGRGVLEPVDSEKSREAAWASLYEAGDELIGAFAGALRPAPREDDIDFCFAHRRQAGWFSWEAPRCTEGWSERFKADRVECDVGKARIRRVREISG